MNVIWLVKGQLKGQSVLHHSRAGDQVHFCCPHCGQDWAQVLAIDDSWWSHAFVMRLCPDCGGSGKLLYPDYGITEQDMPDEVLITEFLAAKTHSDTYHDFLNAD